MTYENIKQMLGLTDEQKDAVKSLNFDKVGSLSIKAMEMIIPYLEQGLRYDEACKKAGYSEDEAFRKKIAFSGFFRFILLA